MAGARLVAALSAGTTGKLKANSPGVATVLPKEANRPLAEQTHGPQTHGPEGDFKRAQAAGTPVGLAATSVSLAKAVRDNLGDGPEAVRTTDPAWTFQARGPPRTV
jgi:hypothetical protein